MGWVREHLSPDKDVRGVIVLGFESATEKLRMAVRGMQARKPLVDIKELSINL